MKYFGYLLLLQLSIILSLTAQDALPGQQNEIFWKLSGDHAIVWDLNGENRLPHSDNMEMDGQRVAAIITYSVDEKRNLSLEREIIFPQLRIFIESSANYWRYYRAYLKDTYTDDFLPIITLEERTFEPGPLDSVRIDGMLHFYHGNSQGLSVERTLLPSMNFRLFTEIWQMTNTTDSAKTLTIGKTEFIREQEGQNGHFTRRVYTNVESGVTILPGQTFTFAIYFTAQLNDEPYEEPLLPEMVVDERQVFLDTMHKNLILETPDPVLNRLFEFSKIRTAESIYDTKMGLVHSPGGGRYYAGVWANDQAEYSGPFFPYLGYRTGNIAAMNAYRQFLRNIPEGDGHFWSSYEMEGTLTCCGLDRGDAAMIAFGASHFALAEGDQKAAEELWPLITWSLDYCERQKNEAGVINSESDEMEGRVATGGANLATSSLYYGALKQSALLAKALGKPKSLIKEYNQQADMLARAIENYFGAEIDSLETYQYFKDYPYLRHWICLPLVVGIDNRKEGTLDALFSKLWTNNGVRVEYNPDMEEPNLFWDRGTLYAFRGAFKAGAANRALEKLHAYSTTRLLGFHVPYVVEAWPEGNMAHLSAESALYVRIFTEGLLGIVPTGFHSFDLTPELPDDWDFVNLKHIRAFSADFDILIKRVDGKLQVKVVEAGKTILNKKTDSGKTLHVVLSK
jgi:hypothetical protein